MVSFSWMVWAVAGVQIVGIFSMLLARVSEGSRTEWFARRLFLGALVMVAIASLLAITAGHGIWPLCSATLGIMTVGATVDVASSTSQSI